MRRFRTRIFKLLIQVTKQLGVLTRSHHFDPWPLSKDADVKFTKTLFRYSCTPYLSLELGTGRIFFSIERSIRAEVVTYRYDAVLGSLHTQQLHGFDELCNVQGIIHKLSVTINTTFASLYLPAFYFTSRILRQTKKIVFFWPFGWRSRKPE
jgi:hypothetical protein